MSPLTVLITTSGTGSRLGTKTRYTNKSLVKLGDKYAICHIIEQYPVDTEFVITLGYYGNLVREFLSIAYPMRTFLYIPVDLFEGPGSSLGYSMLQAQNVLQKPFIFHCCDTIFKNIQIHPHIENKNTVYVAKRADSTSYTSITASDKDVISFHPKGYSSSDYIYTGVCYIYDYMEFWKALEAEYTENPADQTLNDVRAMQVMCNNSISFIYEVVDEYYDTGNQTSFQEAASSDAFRQSHDILEKDEESLCFMENTVIKFFHDRGTNTKRVIRGKHLYPLSPRITNNTDHFMCMDRVEGELLSEVQEHGTILSLLEWSYKNLWIHQQTDSKYIACCERFYKGKTLERISKIPFLNNEATTVNGITTGTIYDVLDRLDFTSLYTDTFYNFHGDYILDNIIRTGSQFILLDWRQEFDTELYFGDRYYDLAKLRHNIIFNHKNITNKLYSVEYTNSSTVYVDLKCNYSLINQLDEYKEFVNGHNLDWKRIKILTAIIWLNMAPLYTGSLREFLFYFGKMNLHLALEPTRP